MFYIFVFGNCNKYWVFILIAKLLVLIWSIKNTTLTQLHEEPKDKSEKVNQNL